MKLAKGKVAVTVDIKAYTRHPNGSKTRDSLEERIENMLRDVFVKYMETLIDAIPSKDKGALVQVDADTWDYRRKKK